MCKKGSGGGGLGAPQATLHPRQPTNKSCPGSLRKLDGIPPTATHRGVQSHPGLGYKKWEFFFPSLWKINNEKEIFLVVCLALTPVIARWLAGGCLFSKLQVPFNSAWWSGTLFLGTQPQTYPGLGPACGWARLLGRVAGGSC